MTREELIDVCLSYPGAVVDCPFQLDTDTVAVRHRLSRKWFALIFTRGGKQCVNLKLEPMKAEFLRSVHVGITSGWHMNRLHWSTVELAGDVPGKLIIELLSDSFELTGGVK